MTSSVFSSSADSVLNREIDNNNGEVLNFSQIWNESHKNVCIDWIKRNKYKKICLQFPDAYLGFSIAISDNLKEALDREAKVFILADTSYGSCCVDEIAAAHVDADSLVHFGNACRSKIARVPVLYLFPEFEFSFSTFESKLLEKASIFRGKEIFIYLDIGYHHILNKPLDASDKCLSDKLHEILPNHELFVKTYPNLSDCESTDDRVCIFIGGNNIRFANLSLTSKAAHWFLYDPKVECLVEENPLTAKYIRRRYFYVEKCKDARTLGLIVATLTSSGYLQVIERLQEMAKKRGKKTQIISVGRINPAKLANFLEIDCFVLIGCPFNDMFNSKDYYKPIVSVFEAEMALNPAWHMKYPDVYVTDFIKLLPEGSQFLQFDSSADIIEQDISLISGRMRNECSNNWDNISVASNTAALNKQRLDLETGPKIDIMVSQTGLTFEDRSWKGLQPALGSTEPARLQRGLRGIPTSYIHD